MIEPVVMLRLRVVASAGLPALRFATFVLQQPNDG
jgi:hypothetical protein